MDEHIISLDIESTITRLRRLVLPLSEQVERRVLSFSRLMTESEGRLAELATHGSDEEQLVGSRILDTPSDRLKWEDEHAVSMRRVARERNSRAQHAVLLDASLAAIHRKGFFSYLRRNRVHGEQRRQLFVHFFCNRDYTRAVVAEHGLFLRSAASYYCDSYVGTDVMSNTLFEQPLHDYELLYGAYFDAYCESVLMSPDADWGEVARSMVYSIKCDLGVLRRTICGLVNALPA